MCIKLFLKNAKSDWRRNHRGQQYHTNPVLSFSLPLLKFNLPSPFHFPLFLYHCEEEEGRILVISAAFLIKLCSGASSRGDSSLERYMGEEEKKEEGKKEEEEGKKVEGDEKKEEEAVEIVLKVDMHCEACARKVARALKGFQGVEDVTADYKASKVIVKGKTADPIKVCQRIQKKSGRKVELISPLPKPPPDDNKEENKEPPTPPPPQDNNKEQPPAVITVVLSIQMHCEACAQVLQKRIRKIKGVESVTTDVGNNKVVVKGIVDPEKLVAEVYKRTRKQASISIVKEEGGEEKKKEEEEKKEEEKKEEEKKVEEKKEGEGEDGGKEGGDDKKTSDIKKNEYWPSKYYYTEYSYPPQFFSDENPNACSLM